MRNNSIEQHREKWISSDDIPKETTKSRNLKQVDNINHSDVGKGIDGASFYVRKHYEKMDTRHDRGKVILAIVDTTSSIQCIFNGNLF